MEGTSTLHNNFNNVTSRQRTGEKLNYFLYNLDDIIQYF